MGTIRNEMTIVHHWKKDELEKVREDAIKFFNELENGISDLMVSPIMTSYINSEYTFVINGDCSKIGWEASKRFHEARMQWCEKHKNGVQNIVVINFGEDDEPCRIVFDNKAESEEKLAMNEDRSEFFDTLDEKLSRADIAFKAYEKGYANAKKDIREGLEKLTVELSTNEFTSAIMHDFYNNLKIIIEGEKVE